MKRTRCDLSGSTYYTVKGLRFGNTQAGSPVWENNDCTVIAIAVVADIRYKLAHGLLKVFGRENRSACDWQEFIARGPFSWKSHKVKKHTVRRFAKEHPEGRFVIEVRLKHQDPGLSHVLTLVNGTLYDCSITKPTSKIIEVWEFRGIKKRIIRDY